MTLTSPQPPVTDTGWTPAMWTLTRWADDLGIEVIDAGPFGPVWDGRHLFAGAFMAASDLSHEIAHWLIAPPALRALPNFGLGRDWQGGDAGLVFGRAERLDAEALASALGIALLKAVEPLTWFAQVSCWGHTMAADPCWTGRWAALTAAVEEHVEAFRVWLATCD